MFDAAPVARISSRRNPTIRCMLGEKKKKKKKKKKTLWWVVNGEKTPR